MYRVLRIAENMYLITFNDYEKLILTIPSECQYFAIIKLRESGMILTPTFLLQDISLYSATVPSFS